MQITEQLNQRGPKRHQQKRQQRKNYQRNNHLNRCLGGLLLGPAAPFSPQRVRIDAEGLRNAGAKSVGLNEGRSQRADIIHSVIRRFRPSLLVADHLPAGVGGELLPALECLRESGGRAVAGFRDILDTADRVRRTWQENRTVFVLREYYAKTLVYGSPDVFDFRRYDLPADLQTSLVYCGYLGRPAVPPEALEEARAYLTHPTLGPRLRECTALVEAALKTRTLEEIFGEVDAMKFQSCMELFGLK